MGDFLPQLAPTATHSRLIDTQMGCRGALVNRAGAFEEIVANQFDRQGSRLRRESPDQRGEAFFANLPSYNRCFFLLPVRKFIFGVRYGDLDRIPIYSPPLVDRPFEVTAHPVRIKAKHSQQLGGAGEDFLGTPMDSIQGLGPNLMVAEVPPGNARGSGEGKTRKGFAR